MVASSRVGPLHPNPINRQIAREVYHLLTNPPPTPDAAKLGQRSPAPHEHLDTHIRVGGLVKWGLLCDEDIGLARGRFVRFLGQHATVPSLRIPHDQESPVAMAVSGPPGVRRVSIEIRGGWVSRETGTSGSELDAGTAQRPDCIIGLRGTTRRSTRRLR